MNRATNSATLSPERSQTASTVCHLGAIPENIEVIAEFIEEIPQQKIHLYTRSQPLLEQLQSLQLEGREIISHLVEPAYPEQWIFKLSREIAERRVQETVHHVPGVLTLKKAPASEALQKLAVRRLSLSSLYLDLSVLVAILNQITPSREEPLFFLSHFFDNDDLKEHEFFREYASAIQISLINNRRSNFKKCSPQALRKLTLPKPVETEQVPEVKQEQTPVEVKQKTKKSPLKAGFSAHYQAHREHFPYKQLRDLESKLRRSRSRVKTRIQRFRLRLADAVRRGKNHLSDFQRPTKKASTLFLACSLSPNKNKYIARIMGPMLHRLQADQQKCLFLINTQDKALIDDFGQAIHQATGQPTDAEMLSMVILSDTQDLFQKLFKANAGQIEPPALPEPVLARVNNTLGSISSFKYLVTSLYYHAKCLDFGTVIGREEDLEVVSMLDILKPALGRSYRTLILPSCLPEYSECYDCISVDDLCVSMGFVKNIFVEQKVNAKRVHVVGSLEWEEAAFGMRLPNAVEKLVQSSSFVLGVVHQPIFVTMHGQALYNQLTMNFMDIYERFLQRHPKAGLLIKPHPSDDPAALRQYFKNLERVEILPNETPAQLFYDSVDAAISMHSTMMMHTMAHGIPVLSMYKYPDYGTMYDYMEQIGGCLATDSHDEALAWLAKLQEDPAFHAQVAAKTVVMKEQCLAVPASEKILGLMGGY